MLSWRVSLASSTNPTRREAVTRAADENAVRGAWLYRGDSQRPDWPTVEPAESAAAVSMFSACGRCWQGTGALSGHVGAVSGHVPNGQRLQLRGQLARSAS